MPDHPNFTIDHVTSADGTRIGYRTIGSGRPLVVVPGSLSDGEEFEPLAHELASEFALVIVDPRGRPLSDPIGDGYSLDRAVEDYQAVLAAVGEPAILFGHSYGAAVSLHVALAAAGLRGVIVYEPPLPLTGPVAARKDEYARLIDEGDIDEALAFGFLNFVGGTPEQLAEFRVTPAWQGMLGIVPSWLPELRTIDSMPLGVERFAAISAPLLGIRGGQSAPHLRESTEAVVGVVPDATLIDVPHVEHSGHLSDPAAIAAVVREWSAQLGR
ncbi:alpha/beta fold hydrolase [Nocardia sp. R7R-8]|uniref:alpha/beta fold hydrolase n=1 Tax=Nocardia sp. R7R-8 TaxID=3459304 RepID=UPI00403E0027